MFIEIKNAKKKPTSIRSNLSFYVSASVQTMVVLLMFYLFYVAGTGIGKYGDEFFSRNHREDASFTTMQERVCGALNTDWAKCDPQGGMFMAKGEAAILGLSVSSLFIGKK